MGRFNERALFILAVCVLFVHTPVEAWYKQSAGPSYYSVGRASGLLSGIRRSAIRRDEANTQDSGEVTGNNAISPASSRNFAQKDTLQAVCVKDIVPELQSCKLMWGSMFRCEAVVIITPDSSDCMNTGGFPLFSD